VKYLISLEPDHNRIDIHAENEVAFRLACYNGHLSIVKYLISLEPEYGRTNIHALDNYAFEKSSYIVQHFLIKHEPDYNWKQVKGYKSYHDTLKQIVEQLVQIHQILIQFDTDILELNVIGIVKEFLLG
jgi:hypothetical protein